jgi:hypothetical protein
LTGGTPGQRPGPTENLPPWMVLDQRRRDRYLFAVLQGVQHLRESGWSPV